MRKTNLLMYGLVLVFLLCNNNLYTKSEQTPRITVIMIVDQFAYHYIPKLSPFFRYGFRELLDKGQVYTNAFHAQAVPETTPGHHVLSTGVLPKDHGAILNQWYDKNYKKIPYADDHSPQAAILDPDGDNKIGKSPHNTRVDGLSDQFVQASADNNRHMAFAISLKSYPALATANRLGKAFWLDDVSGNFTSSKAYFETQPAWVEKFNREHKTSQLNNVKWTLRYLSDNVAYKFPYTRNYEYAALPFSMIERKVIPIDHKAAAPYNLFEKTPAASKLLLDFAKTCIENNMTESTDHMLLWVELSNLDLLCHYYGPDSLETIDLIYHLDRQIENFMNFVRRQVGEKNCLFVLTADHGIMPIPEIMQQRGQKLARRIMAQPLIDQMNKIIKNKYNIDCIVKAFEPTFFVLNRELLAAQNEKQQQAILQSLKNYLLQQTGIKQVWTSNELKNATFEPYQLENHYKTQLFNGRSGDLFCMPEPYCLITHYAKGASHSTPYDYDTHVPLVLYQKGRFQKKTFNDHVWTGQIPVSLASIMKVGRPSASTYPVLPGIN
jgi:predicted AlkP superfamily pyrophosphatase or phosphodiesterase